MANFLFRRAPGVVYFFQAPNGEIKIGCTGLSPTKRLQKVGYSIKAKLNFIHEIATNDARWLERQFHIIFRNCNTHGEWFILTAEQVEKIKSITRYDSLELLLGLKSPPLAEIPGKTTSAAAHLGRKGGKIGGPARNAALSPERRREIARQGGIELQRRRREARQNNSANQPPAE